MESYFSYFHGFFGVKEILKTVLNFPSGKYHNLGCLIMQLSKGSLNFLSSYLQFLCGPLWKTCRNQMLPLIEHCPTDAYEKLADVITKLINSNIGFRQVFQRGPHKNYKYDNRRFHELLFICMIKHFQIYSNICQMESLKSI